MAYIGVSPSNGVRRVHTYTATASQTTFSGAGAEGTSLSYKDSNFVDVYQNGIKLGDADYTSTSGTSIVLAQGASVDDLVVVVVFDVFSVADTVSKADGGTFDGNVTMAGTLGVTGATTLTGGVSGNTTFSGEIITSTSGTSNVRIGENAGDAIASGGNYNTVVGDEAGTAITTGDGNTAVGFEALKTEDAHGFNTAVGYQTLKMQNAGAEGYNVAVGHQAGTAITTGIANVIVGALAGDAMTTGQINVLVGTNTGSGLTEGLENVAMGHNSLLVDTKGQRSTALGYGTLAAQNFTSLTEVYNTAVGFNAGAAVTTGIYNTAVGGLAGDALTDADYNIAIGGLALSSDTKGSNSVAVGYRALTTQNNSSATQANNTAIGTNAGASVTDGINNVFVGHGAGAGHQSGDHSIYIGRDAGYHATPTTTGSYNIFIGSFTDGDANDTGAMIVMGYNVTSVGNQNFTFGNNTTDSNIAFGATSISAPSDERLKEDIKDETVGLAFINELRPVTFQWKKANDIPTDMKAYDKDSDERVMNGKYNHGFIAQEVKAVIDKYDIKNGCNLWSESGEDKRQRLAEGELVPFLVKALQELSAQVTTLQAEVKALKGE